MPEDTVQAFAQTPDHFLWIGTSGGLVRFDGAQFAVFNRDSFGRVGLLSEPGYPKPPPPVHHGRKR